MNKRSVKPTALPRKGSHQGSSGIKILSISTIGAKKRRTLSGIIMYVISETKTIISSDTNVHETINSFDHPTNNGEIVKRIAVTISTDAYIGEILTPQFLHFPF